MYGPGLLSLAVEDEGDAIICEAEKLLEALAHSWLGNVLDELLIVLTARLCQRHRGGVLFGSLGLWKRTACCSIKQSFKFGKVDDVSCRMFENADEARCSMI